MEKNLPANARDTVQSLVWEGSTCHGQLKPLCHNSWACALGPSSCNWAHMPQLLCCARREATTVRSLWTTVKSSPPPATTRPSLHSNEDPAQPEINKQKEILELHELKYYVIVKWLQFFARAIFKWGSCKVIFHKGAAWRQWGGEASKQEAIPSQDGRIWQEGPPVPSILLA